MWSRFKSGLSEPSLWPHVDKIVCEKGDKFPMTMVPSYYPRDPICYYQHEVLAGFPYIDVNNSKRGWRLSEPSRVSIVDDDSRFGELTNHQTRQLGGMCKAKEMIGT